ncbi:hypothetical protein [Jeotgalibacillus malaysiensis]|uniref:hypothetical protein n=1 Tax=Jeotgalibacillus malaysiensis TaxID=1508404 RepID=UPI00384F6253
MSVERKFMNAFIGEGFEDQKVMMDVKKSFYGLEDETVTFSLDSKDYFENDLIEKWMNEFMYKGWGDEEELKERFAESPLNQYAELIFE